MVYYYEELAVDYNQVADWHRNFVVANIENYTVEHLPLDIYGNTKPSVVINEMKNNINAISTLTSQFFIRLNSSKGGMSKLARLAAKLKK